MAEFSVGDIAYIKDKVVAEYFLYSDQLKQAILLPGQRANVQIGLAKDIPFTIIAEDQVGDFYVTNFTDNWGDRKIIWNGQKYKTWCFSPAELEKRDLNTVSLQELNRGL